MKAESKSAIFNKRRIARRASGIVGTIIHTGTYLVEVIGNRPRNQIEIVGQIPSHF